MTDKKAKWNRIYQGQTGQAVPAAILTRHPAWIPDHGRALDIACGRGANATALAEAGLTVDAWDISDVAIKALQAQADRDNLPITAHATDISVALFEGRTWDLILNCHYLDRALTPAIQHALSPGGLVFFQTFTRAKVAQIGPNNPEFLLAEDELLDMFRGFEVLVYEDESGNPDQTHPLAGRAALIARKP